MDKGITEGRIEVDFEDEASVQVIEERLSSTDYHILHYTGHGAFSQGNGQLLLEDNQGNSVAKDAAVISQLLGQHPTLRLIFLSGCQTAMTDAREAFTDLATPLLAKGIPAVVAMQASITDESALQLASGFYRSLAAGKPVDIALSEARRRLLLSEQAIYAGEFATPAMFALSPEGIRFKEPEPTEQAKSAAPHLKVEKSIYLNLEQLGTEFIGRQPQLRRILRDFIHLNKRLIIIHGLGGIGKTVLSTKAAERMAAEHGYWIYGVECRGGGLSVDRFLTELNSFLILNDVNALSEVWSAPVPLDMKANLVGQVLSQMKLLLIFDNFEDLLNEERKIKDDDLARLLRVIVNHCRQGAKFLFTSRYRFDLQEEGRGEDNIDEIGLDGLSPAESIILLNRSPEVSSKKYGFKHEVAERTGGHPLTLGLFGKACRKRGPEEVLADIQGLDEEMVRKILLDDVYSNLGPQAKELINRASAFNKPVGQDALEWMMAEEVRDEALPLHEMEKLIFQLMGQVALRDERLLQELKSLSGEDLLEWLKAQLPVKRKVVPITREIEELIDWGLLVVLEVRGEEDTRQILYEVHRLVREYVKGRVREKWSVYKRQGAEYYLNAAQMAGDAVSDTFLQLEAREMYFDAGDYEEATEIVNNNAENLLTWGFIHLMVELLKESARTTTGKSKAVSLHHLGIMFRYLGDYVAARAKYNITPQHLRCPRECYDCG
ncbi:MAG: CHAT domain-containing protein, partial [bacterium]|nr:CHAT domain-containing protein [bacterium]